MQLNISFQAASILFTRQLIGCRPALFYLLSFDMAVSSFMCKIPTCLYTLHFR